MNEIKIKNEFSEVDLMKDNSITKIVTDISELLPLVEVGASWEVCAFVSHIYLPSSLGSPYPDIFFLAYFFFF